MKLRTILLLLLTAYPVCTISAQSLAAFRERLAVPEPGTDSYIPVSVTVTERGDAADAVAKAAEGIQRLRFKGYRVCVFFDNRPNARARAEAAEALFASSYPEIPVQMSYDTPYFKVMAGNCINSEEAIILLERVKELFPKAIIKSEELSVADMVK